MQGIYNRILQVDLTDKSYEIKVNDIPSSVYEAYLGGKGLGTYLLYQYNPPGVDPLSPDNHIVFATGPVAGSRIWGSCRYGVFTKSPQTMLYSESYSGGKAPEAMDSAGYDAIIIFGRSSTPIVLSIHPKGVTFHDASDVWGKDTYDTEDILLKRFRLSNGTYGRPGAVVIGPASENLVKFGVIENDYWRSAGRTGVGTVLGSKRLKGIVFQGDCKRPLADPDTVRIFSRDLSKESKENPGVKAYKSMGTPMMVKLLNNAKAFPTRYWSAGTCEHWEKINSDALHNQCEVKPRACLKCFMACGRMSRVIQGRHSGLAIEGPEYETIYAFGGLCMVDSIEEIIYLNDICDRLGMDTISAGNLCAFAIEAGKRGRIDDAIDYGDVDAIADLLKKIAYRQGIGDILANGIRYAAKAWDLEEIAVHAKGLEPAGYDPRVLKGMGLAYATSDRGACHLRATFYKPELSGIISPEQTKGKAEVFVDFEDRLTLFDALVFCRFYRDMYAWDQLEEIVHMVTGIDVDKCRLQEMAASISTLVRRFNIREGMLPEDDSLSAGLFRKLKGTDNQLTQDELAYMLKDYYQLRGWDEAGVPPGDGKQKEIT
jgi:aldehyde:ferredoxin oxidoreductase